MKDEIAEREDVLLEKKEIKRKETSHEKTNILKTAKKKLSNVTNPHTELRTGL